MRVDKGTLDVRGRLLLKQTPITGPWVKEPDKGLARDHRLVTLFIAGQTGCRVRPHRMVQENPSKLSCSVTPLRVFGANLELPAREMVYLAPVVAITVRESDAEDDGPVLTRIGRAPDAFKKMGIEVALAGRKHVRDDRRDRCRRIALRGPHLPGV
jgi:hypothetical protein